jgi:hypothetical protein
VTRSGRGESNRSAWLKPVTDRTGVSAGGGIRIAAILAFCGLTMLSGRPATADQLVFPREVERSGTVAGSWRFERPETGRGALDLDWSDADGRVVEQRHMALDLAGAAAVDFTLDMRRAVAMQNRLVAHLSIDGAETGGEAHRDAEATASFIAAPPDQPWSGYQIIMWQPQTAAGYRALKRLGVSAGLVHGDRSDGAELHFSAELDPLLAGDTQFYVENIATDFYASYHRWAGEGRPVNWRFLAAKQRYGQDPNDRSVFIRDPGLSEPQWLDKIANRLARHVRALHPYRPLYYSLGDETGTADLAAMWDFDLAPSSLAGMREWLKGRYGSLDALNGEWGASFASWDAVEPMLTAEVLKREDGNFAAWADFKEWMDVAFARAVAAGSAALHSADPDAVAAIEGCQIPGSGGYDYSRLAGAVDAMELYDYGDNVELVRSLAPQKILLTTSFVGGRVEQHRVWRELLRGARGLVLWDEKREFVDANGNIGPRGELSKTYFNEIRDGLGALLINSERHTDPIGILSSPASLRVEWVLDRQASGEDWTRRQAGTEYQNNATRIATRNFVGVLEHMGLQHRFVAADRLVPGELQSAGYRVVILPQIAALSSRTADAIRDFVAQGGVAIADGEPGLYDEHGRRRAQFPLADLFEAASAERAILLTAPEWPDGSSGRHLASILSAFDIVPRFPLAHADGSPVADVETYRFRNGAVTILALLRDLPNPPAGPGPRPRALEPIVVGLPQASNVYDLREHRGLGRTERVEVALDPVEPTILALSDAPLSPPSIEAPAEVRLGGSAEIAIRTNSGAARDVVHVEAIDPSGTPELRYSGNLVGAGTFAKLLPLALNDKPGTWTIRATAPLGGTATAKIGVEP